MDKTCIRCEGLMSFEDFGGDDIDGYDQYYRCLNCGDITNENIRVNRLLFELEGPIKGSGRVKGDPQRFKRIMSI